MACQKSLNKSSPVHSVSAHSRKGTWSSWLAVADRDQQRGARRPARDAVQTRHGLVLARARQDAHVPGPRHETASVYLSRERVETRGFEGDLRVCASCFFRTNRAQISPFPQKQLQISSLLERGGEETFPTKRAGRGESVWSRQVWLAPAHSSRRAAISDSREAF